jgi:hypothetical protein
MTVSEFRWQNTFRKSSPSASGQAGAVLSLARLWARLPSLATIPLKKIGEVQLEPDLITLVDELAQPQLEGMAWFQLGRATEQAWVGVTLNACHRLIRPVLGGAAPQTIRPLSSGETGLMAAFVFAGLQSLGLAHHVTVAPSGGPPLGRRHLLLGAALRGEGGTDGRVLFVGPWAWLGEWPQPLTMPAQDTVEACLELGRTAVPAADLETADLGDAIVFDGIAGMSPGDTWQANLVLGDQLAPARLDPEGNLSLEGSWSQHLWGAADSQDESGSPAPRPAVVGPDPSVSLPHREVVAEIGRLSLSRNDLVTLIKGEGLLLGPRPSDQVLLRVDGQPWAEGGLVVLAGQLAIRILQWLAT